MAIAGVFVALGEENLAELLRGVSMGKLRTYQMFERVKVRFHLGKLNSETLRKAAPRLFARVRDEADPEFGSDLAQVVLVSHMDMIRAVLDFLTIPHEDGFFAKDADVSQYLTDGWQNRVYQEFTGKYPYAILVFYINHLAVEVAKAEDVFLPAKS